MKSRRILTYALIALVVLPTVGLTFLLSFSDPTRGIEFPLQVSLDNITTLLRTYNFRVALFNTVQQIVLTTIIAVPVAWILARGMRGRHHHIWIALLLTPALFPASLAAMTWRQILEPSMLLDVPMWSVSASAVLNAWRLVPWGILLLMGSSHDHLKRGLGHFAAWILLATLVDPGMTLLFSAGQPFNATHTWASWLAVSVRVTRLWGPAATIAGGMALVLVIWFWWMQRLPPLRAVSADGVGNGTAANAMPDHFAFGTLNRLLSVGVLVLLWSPVGYLLFQYSPRTLWQAAAYLPVFDLFVWTTMTAGVVLLSANIGRALSWPWRREFGGLHSSHTRSAGRYAVVACIPLWPVALHYGQIFLAGEPIIENGVSGIAALILSTAVVIACLTPFVTQSFPTLSSPYLWAALIYVLQLSNLQLLWIEPRLLASGIIANLAAYTAQPPLLTVALLYTWILIAGINTGLLAASSG